MQTSKLIFHDITAIIQILCESVLILHVALYNTQKLKHEDKINAKGER